MALRRENACHTAEEVRAAFSIGRMESEFKKRFIQSVANIPDVLKLFARNGMTLYHQQLVLRHEKPAETFWDYLWRRTPYAFKELVVALRMTNQNELADILEQTLQEQYPGFIYPTPEQIKVTFTKDQRLELELRNRFIDTVRKIPEMTDIFVKNGNMRYWQQEKILKGEDKPLEFWDFLFRRTPDVYDQLLSALSMTGQEELAKFVEKNKTERYE